MTPNEYQQLAARTICDQGLANLRMTSIKPPIIQINHAVVGLVGEVGELAGTLERAVYYGQPLDINNLFEELGDCLWYIAEMCAACGFKLEDVMTANIAKLCKRYPDKYTDHHAAEENRDRVAEAEALNPHGGRSVRENKSCEPTPHQ